MMSFDTQQVELALHQLYHDTNVYAQANHFLTLAQISPEAWNFAWQLLDCNKSPEIQYFGANTLHTKISRYWHEVPKDQYESLRTKLSEAIVHYSRGPRLILTRLCVAMSSFVIHTISEFWPTAIIDLITLLQPQNIPDVPSQNLLNMLLELLTVLPEEFQMCTLSRSERDGILNSLQQSLPHVLSLLDGVLDLEKKVPSEICEMAIKCYSSWSQLGFSILEHDSLKVKILNAVYDEELCQTALEALTNVTTHPNSYKYPNTLIKLTESLVQLEPFLDKMIADKEMDVCSSLYSLFIGIGEMHSKILLHSILDKPETKDTLMKLFSFILKCSGTPGCYPVDETCSEQAFGFWYTIQDEITSSEPPKYEALLLLLHPLFHSLVDTYLVKVQHPPEEGFVQWHVEERESLRCYRQDIGDSFTYCYNILQESMLASLMAHFNLAINILSKDPSKWQYAEACLYGFQSVAESVDLKESHYIPQFFNFLTQVPLHNIRMVSTAMDCIGAYGEWINSHPSVMSSLVPLLLVGLQDTEIAPSASMALKDIARDCQECLAPVAEDILRVVQAVLQNNVLKSRERVRVMGIVGHVLSIMPRDYILAYLQSLLAPQLQSLQQASSAEPSASTKMAIVPQLNMLSPLFSSLDPKNKEQENASLPHPVLLVVQQILPTLMVIGTKWAKDEQVVEALCECVKKAISTLLLDCGIILLDVLQLLLNVYLLAPNPPVLDDMKTLFLLFGNSDEFQSHMKSSLVHICNNTLLTCQNDFQGNTVVLEAFFQMLSQLIKKTKGLLLNDGLDLNAVFNCGIAALALPEKPTVKASASFLSEFITNSRDFPVMLNIVNNCGEMLVEQVLRVIGGESPRSAVEHMSDIFLAFSKKYFDNFCRWMTTFVQKPGFPSSRVSQEEKEKYARQILKERSNKRRMKEIVTEFSLTCRGLIDTEYASQSTFRIS